MTTINQIGNSLAGASGTGSFVGSNSPSLITPNLDIASATSINFGGSPLANYIPPTPFTPTFSFATPGDLSVVYTDQTGFYSRIGNVVFFNMSVLCTPTWTTGSGGLRLNGLPINIAPIASSGSQFCKLVLATVATYTAGRTLLVAQLAGNQATSAQFIGWGNASTNTVINATGIISGQSLSAYASGRYFV